jgi:hypothetical protein
MKAKLIKQGGDYILLGAEILATTVTGNEPAISNKLSLTNCLSIEFGCDLDELAKRHYDEKTFIMGFQKALELTGDRMFTEVDMKKFGEYMRFENSRRRIEPIDTHFDDWKSPQQWDVEIVYETETPTPFVKRTVVRKLENGEECEWTCFWDNGWWDSSSGVRIPGVISWTPQPLMDSNRCIILKRA